MPKGPKGEKRPADVIGTAIRVAKIATGEIEEDIDDDGKNKAAQELGRKGGRARIGRQVADALARIADLEHVIATTPARTPAEAAVRRRRIAALEMAGIIPSWAG